MTEKKKNTKAKAKPGTKAGPKAAPETNEDIMTTADQFIDRLTSEEGRLLFEGLTQISKPREALEIDVEGHKVKIIKPDKTDLMAAIVMFSRMMEHEKNQMGYRDFIAMVDEFEFMFFLSYFTNIGYREDLGGYMKIHDLFDATGASETLMMALAEEVDVARASFGRLYKLWEGEFLAASNQVISLASPGSELAARFLEMMDEAPAGNDDIDTGMLMKIIKAEQELDAEEAVLKAPGSSAGLARKYNKIIPMDPAKLRVLGEES